MIPGGSGAGRMAGAVVRCRITCRPLRHGSLCTPPFRERRHITTGIMPRPSVILKGLEAPTMEDLEPGWLYKRMQKNREEYEKISQWQKDMAEYVLNHGTDDEED